jgi:hypothetical protein
MNPADYTITWIAVEKPTLDLIGVVLSSFKLAGILLVLALGVGSLLGLGLILARRRPAPSPIDSVSLNLGAR